MERKEKSGSFRTLWDRYKFVLLVVLLGVALLAWPTGKKAAAQAEETTGASDVFRSEAETEEQMRKILSRIDGAGEVELMLTVESTEGKVLAQDTELSYSGATAAPNDYDRRSTTVLASRDGGDEPVSTAQLGPTYRGALVVCPGASNAEVKLAVTQAVAALTGLSSDRILVVKCQ